jgi:gluconokinase
VWTQIIANVLGRTLSRPEIHEASSRGAVLLALEKIGALNNLEALTPPKGATFVPEKKLQGVYVKALTRHRIAYDALMSSAVDAMMSG